MGLGDSDTMDEKEGQALEAFKKFLQNSHLPRFPEYMIRKCQNIWASRFQGAGEMSKNEFIETDIGWPSLTSPF